MGHDHDHSHGHGHGNRRRLGIAFGITVTILVAEVIGALVTGSLALLVDAAHMLTDAAGLLMALVASSLMLRPPTARHTWGYRRAEVLSAAAQSLVLFGVGIYALAEGIRRLFEPAELPAGGLLVFGVIGLVGNLVAILVLVRGRGSNLNLRAAFLEVVNDALGSVGVIVSALVIATTGWVMIDTLVGLFIAALIMPRAVRILLSAVRVLMESSPRGLDMVQVRAHLLELPHVQDVHDLHAAEIGTGLPVLTAHVALDAQCFVDGHALEHLDAFRTCVGEHFDIRIEHATFQLETEGYAAQEQLAHA
ncbi:MAG: cation diffusion facilitator family transporter [Micrococcaceae bacterium]